MAEVALTVWTAVAKEDRATCVAMNKVPMRYANSGGNYIGLRERREDAVERARFYSTVPVTQETHILLKTKFSAAGVAHFMTQSSGAQHAYAPMLFKMVYKESEYDWKVWHFQDDLPLESVTNAGLPLVTSEWEELE